MSEDFSVLIGDPGDRADSRIGRLGALPREPVLAWMARHDVLDPEGETATWTSSGVVAEIYLNADSTGTLRSVDASLYGSDDETYEESHSALLVALHELASSVGARLWSESDAYFVEP